MASPRKRFVASQGVPGRAHAEPPARAGDVPTGVVAGVLAVLLAVFVPVVQITPDLPAQLPPLAFPPRAVLARPRPAPARPVPREIDAAFDALAAASAARNGEHAGRFQRAFAARVADDAGVDDARRDAIRDHHLARFLAAVDRGAQGDPLVAVAARHGLTHARGRDPATTRAMLVAWFDLRWEAVSSRESLRGTPVGLERLTARLPEAERRALAAWALASDCAALLGAPAGEPALAPPQLERCAAVRREFAGLARRLEPAYPVDEARAAVEALLARQLGESARRAQDPSARDAAHAAARDAYARAHGLYTLLAERAPSRRLQRYVLGAARGMNL